jgi:PAS domain S-box-containing protein
MGPRQIAPVALVLALTIAGFVGARELGEHDASRATTHRADIAATQIHGRVNQSADLMESLRRFMVGHVDVTNAQFSDLGSSILSAVGLAAAAWAEPVSATERAAYERRVGHRIVVTDRFDAILPSGPRPSYLPATLVTGFPPATVPGVDLGRQPSVAAAAARPSTLYRTVATRPTKLADGTLGLFLVMSAQRVTSAGVYPGVVALFVPQSWLLAAGEQTAGPRLRLRIGGVPVDNATARSSFTALGQRFAVSVPEVPVRGSAVVLPWLVLGCGLALAAFAAALGVNGARRAGAQRQLDHIFNLSADLISIASLDGYFKRINPAFEPMLGYTAEELLRRPFIELVHPDDRERTLVELAALNRGEATISFENRYVCKDGSVRWLQWVATPVLEQRQIYAVARDVTERRRAETELRAAEERTRRLAEEQAALRRVATLVANGVPPAELFAAVAEEVGQLLHATTAQMARYEPDGTVTFIAGWSSTGEHLFPAGARYALGGTNLNTLVFETGRTSRIDSYRDASGPIGAAGRELGWLSAIGTPIVVEGSVWGMIALASTQEQPLPPDTESRLVDFNDLVATAVANAASRAELAASRARIVATADETRRRIERDLHDGAQQRLVTLSLALRSFDATLPPGEEEILAQVAEGLVEVIGQLRELSQGLHPAILSEGGLGPALRTLARRSPVPVELEIQGERRLPEQVEVAAYYVVSEALANAAEHAQASVVHVALAAEDGRVALSIRDDGVGGADPEQGSGLIGLRDRIEALGGTIEIESAPGRGTALLVTIPLDGRPQLP